MKQYDPFLLVMWMMLLLLHNACKKDAQVPNIPVNQPKAPIAIAGKDTTVYLPFSEITLDGSGSKDPDNNIIQYQWKIITNSGQFNITNSNKIKAVLNGLIHIGQYAAELTVTDEDQLSSKDTVIITVAQANCTKAPRTYIFEDLSWNYSWIMEIDIFNRFSYLPSNSKILNIYIKRDASADWEVVAPLLTSDYKKHEWGFGNNTLVIYPPITNRSDDKPDVKIEYCQ